MKPDELMVHQQQQQQLLNLQQLQPHHGERRSAETMSETSEGTTTTTLSGQHGFESREELLELAAVLRLNLDELHRERFRVDRRKLEHMLLGDDEAPETAEVFFHKIMNDTNTFVTWPSRLKIGAKSKKDPHIKVAGRVDDVRAAKDKIMQILDTRQSMRVTMKLDVSYTDHSHIIGKGGLTIKRVMEETGCHIHFPDSNRSNHQEKSNQVSIAGEMEGVEKARARVRNLTPLIFSFELPIMGTMQSPPDPTSPYIVKIQEKYNVQVMFRTRPKLHATLVVVKGCEWEVAQVKEATVFLIHHMCKNLASQIQIQMTMEISPQHHSIVLGKQSNNLKMIMQRTSTQIIFPDAGDPNIPSLKKSNVTITGAINNVYSARQQLLGSLPLVLMFDLPENSMPAVETETIAKLMQTLDVFVNVRHKPKQSTLSVIIKGVERNATNVYEARRQLLALEEAKVQAEIPQNYLIPNAGSVFQNHSINNNNNFISGDLLTINTQSPSPYCVSPLPHSPVNLSPHWSLQPIHSAYSPLLHHHPFSFPHATTQLLAARQAMLNQQSLLQQGLLAPQSHPPGFPPQFPSNVNYQKPKSEVKDNSAYMSLSSASSTLSSPAVSPRNISPINSSQHSNLDISGILLSDLSVGENNNNNNKGPTSHLTPYDYDQKRIMAMKALKTKPKANEYRVPTPTWAGYGLSQTMPAEQAPSTDLWDDPTNTPLMYGNSMRFDGDQQHQQQQQQDCLTPIVMTSGYLDHTPRSRLDKILTGNHSDLSTALINGGLDKKWIDILSSHEIDMTTFISLTEKDLLEIGVTAWGPRRKMMLLIAELKKRTKTFSGSAAPGAERRASLTIPPVQQSNSGNSVVEGKW